MRDSCPRIMIRSVAWSDYEKYIYHQLQRPPYYSLLLSEIQYRNIIKNRLDHTTTTTLGRRDCSAQQVETAYSTSSKSTAVRPLVEDVAVNRKLTVVSLLKDSGKVISA